MDGYTGDTQFPLRQNHPAKLVWDLILLATVLVFTYLITYKMVFHTFEADALYYSLNFLFLLDLAAGASRPFPRSGATT